MTRLRSFFQEDEGAGAQPVLAFARMVLQERGWSVLVVWDEITDLDSDDVTRHQWAVDRALAALDWIAVPHVLFVGKSLSSFAAGVAADRGLPALWYTPLLSVPIIVSDLRRRQAALALVGGTADDFWHATTARETGAAILELEGVDHSLSSRETLSVPCECLNA
jgi:hypothetical protein